MSRPGLPGRVELLLGTVLPILLLAESAPLPTGPLVTWNGPGPVPGSTNSSVVGNFSAALGRLVTLLAAGGGALLALVWARVALSWFSNDVAKKVQAKDRARDALIGTLVFTAAVTGLAWALAQWVVSGS